MSSRVDAAFVATVQALAISHSVYRGSLDALVDVVTRAMEAEGISPDEAGDIPAMLLSKSLKAALINRNVALFRGQDGHVRLIDQQPRSYRAALIRIESHGGADRCRYCGLRENPRELVQERDPNGDLIAGSFTHLECVSAFRKLRLLVMAKQDLQS